jgi:hypothetical protein
MLRGGNETVAKANNLEISCYYGFGSSPGSGYGEGEGYGDAYGPSSGYGSGYGSGSGYGDGDGGYGDGYSGEGYGDGEGYGSGKGYGDGDGGYGDGYCGEGYGDGEGYGSGEGHGDGDSEEFAAALARSLAPDRVRELPQDAVIAFWRSDSEGKPANGGSGNARTVGMIEEIAGPLAICTKHALHGTFAPQHWNGSRLWLVALYPPIQRERAQVASLKREILAEVVPNFYQD